MAELSPMMTQYFEIKNRHPDMILFFRLGDFYEMFFDDAILASRELELTLTGRDCGLEERAPMCGVPFHSYENYVARLIAKGYKVAICEQMEDPALAKGLVKRDIIRIITPGTVIESNMLKDDRNNYIGSMTQKGNRVGLCFADISTGTAYITDIDTANASDQLVNELSRFMPSELLMDTVVSKISGVLPFIQQNLICSVETLAPESYSDTVRDQYLPLQFGENWQKIPALQKVTSAQNALAALLCYLHETQKKGVERLTNVNCYNSAQYMYLSPVTRENLELVQTIRGREKKGTLLWVMDNTETAMGKRLLRTWLEQPLLDCSQINNRLDCVEALTKDSDTRSQIKDQLAGIYDLERLMTRMVYGSSTPREVSCLALTCEKLPALKELISHIDSPSLQQFNSRIDNLADVAQRIKSCMVDEPPVTLKDGGVIREGFNAEVDELRTIIHGGKGFLTDLEAKLREETGIPKLKIGYNRVFGYYIEISRVYKGDVPAHFIRKQTLANAERYITEELKDLENKILGANERLSLLEHELFADLLTDLAANMSRIQVTADAIAHIDVFVSFAQVAVQNHYVRPMVDDSDCLLIEEGRHPVVEKMLGSGKFVPNDTLLDCRENRTAIITGPNMAGKSTYMRQNALIALMAQVGSFVPAKKCQVGLIDAIFTRVGASDNLSAGQSTFMVEMTEVAEIVEKATPKSLVILDEIGRGTSTFDGMSIARAVLEHFNSTADGAGCKTLFATHYHELTELSNQMDGIRNYNIAVKKRGDDITFLRRIVKGPADDSYGIAVAKLAGLPQSITDKAKIYLRQMEKSSAQNNVGSQIDFDTYEQQSNAQFPGEMLEKLKNMDADTLTPIEALNLIYEIKQVLAD